MVQSIRSTYSWEASLKRMLLEAAVGPTFQPILAKQFQALRAGDRFFWAPQGFDRRTALIIEE
jgi:hypothetical protein